MDLKLPHPERKPQSVILPGVVTKFTGTELTIRHPAPGRLGEDNVRLLKETLGMTEEEVARATADGAFE